MIVITGRFAGETELVNSTLDVLIDRARTHVKQPLVEATACPVYPDHIRVTELTAEQMDVDVVGRKE